ncbi:MAG: right-handed parallel beta-helix repeat-containing protein, partial [Chloroflexi bacterium]|nr:right-handed parallel beta-helix repeat-containing protein [Chloroflexota bacterium]
MKSRLLFLAVPVLAGLAGLSFLYFMLCEIPMVQADTLCVRPGGGGGCYEAIQIALTNAQGGDTIRVAEGDYIENVRITKTVTLEGGWNTQFTERDPAVYVTTISPAETNDSVVAIMGQYQDPALVAPTLDGFTITGGRGDLGFYHGGGLQIRHSNALVANNVITGNIGYLLGGGVWVQQGAPHLENNRIENNQVFEEDAEGGGVELEGTQAVLVNNIIANNVVNAGDGQGGGVSISGGGPLFLTGNQILSNTVGPTGYVIGGGIFMEYVTATLEANVIQGNVANSPEAGFGGGVAILYSQAITLSGELISGNSINNAVVLGGFGGGIYTRQSSVFMDRLRVQANCAGFDGCHGGGIFLEGPFTLVNSLVTDNLAPNSSAIYMVNGSDGHIANTTIAANDGMGIITGSPLTLSNSIIMSHTVGVLLIGAVSVTVTYNDFYANSQANVLGFSLDPSNLLIDPLLDADYHLSDASPVRDAGQRSGAVPGKDLDGESRYMIGPSGLYRVDIGADEATGPAQQYLDLEQEAADLTIVGPGNPADNP